MARERKSLSKKIRFEVFKRDSFTCQYCGKSAPDSILHIDHINPVSAGGKNEILNLITSCIDCNLGKGARELSDQSIVKKQIDQMKAISLRQEQLAMMAEWRNSLLSLEDQSVNIAHEHINKVLAHTKFKAIEEYKNTIRTMLKKYTLDEIYQAVDASAGTYLRTSDDEAVNKFLAMLPRVCYWRRAEKEDPTIVEINRIVAIGMKRWYRCDRHILHRQLVHYHRELNVPLDVLKANVSAATGIMKFQDFMEESLNG